ncbi:MAG TPA: hypothetical protein VFC07_01235 [Verrucomicrobiae bacterium]|nr:hypothetical protein [Verrucomicrobiae bacterium]
MKPVRSIQPRNLSAQLQYRARGNPPSTHPDSAVSNCFPGLETDCRNLWRRILKGIQLHEARNTVIAVDDPNDAQLQVLADGWRLISIMDTPVTLPVTGPVKVGEDNQPLSFNKESSMPLEWSNALALLLSRYAGMKVRCNFEKTDDPNQTLAFNLILQSVFEEGQAVISRELVPPGELSQSLCSPWMSDYRECYCFYWAATRPDFVNVETRPDGTSMGHNWMRKDRTAQTPKIYVADDPADQMLMAYSDLYKNWEKLLKFVIGGRSEETVSRPPQDAKPEPRRSHARTNRNRNRRLGGKKA